MIERKKIILVDIDSTLNDFNGGILTEWKKRYPQYPFIEIDKLEAHNTRTEYAKLNPLFEKLVDEIISTEEFLLNLQPIPGALTVLDEMEQAGFEVFICGSFNVVHNNTKAKIAWVKKHFGEKWAKRVILSYDKTLITGDILIDDRPKILGISMPTFIHVLFDQPYNRNEDKPRIKHWDEWKKVIFNVLNLQ